MRKRRSKAEWRALIEAQESSGVSVRAFCEARGLNENYFHKRRQALKGSAFAAVQVQPTAIGVVIRHGEASVECCGASATWIADVLKALR